MLFSSVTFLYVFLPVVLILYFLVFRKNKDGRNVFLFFASLVFYAWGEPKFVFVIIMCIIINWFFGIQIEMIRNKGKTPKYFLIADIVFNLVVLYVFKYLCFSIEIFSRITGKQMSVPVIALPIGISFFTFQAMSYVIDVYRGNADAQKSILDVGLYISFFPQLIAGPIVRYETIADEIVNRRETIEDLTGGFARFIIGLSKKVLLANSFALLADGAFQTSIQGNASLSVCYSWLGAIAYTLQIFFDFSGYSDMAIGLGSVFGFHFQENFCYPYISTSVSDFWRRWHISLGSWFRDYLYIPLGGSRKGLPRTIFNLFIIWFLTGLWHGANTTFIVWGLLYFVLITAEKLTEFEKHNKKFIFLRWAYTMFFVVLGWVIFRADSLHAAIDYLKAMFGLNGNPFSDGNFQGFFTQNQILLALGVVFCTPITERISRKLGNNSVWQMLRAVMLVFLLILSVSSLVSSSYNPFIYFQF